MVYASVRLRIDLKRDLDCNAKIVACATNRPEQFRMRVLGCNHYASIGEHELARHHVVV